jgi:hypothetical protein
MASPILVRLHQIAGVVGPVSSPIRPEGYWAEPDVGSAPAAMRHFYDYPDVVREPGRGTQASVIGPHDATVAAASFGEGRAGSRGAGGDR